MGRQTFTSRVWLAAIVAALTAACADGYVDTTPDASRTTRDTGTTGSSSSTYDPVDDAPAVADDASDPSADAGPTDPDAYVPADPDTGTSAAPEAGTGTDPDTGTSDPPPSDDAGPAPAPGCPAAPPTGGTCTGLTPGPSFLQVNIAEDLPTPAGGDFPDGIWTMVGSRIYTGAGGASGPTGNVIAGRDIFCAGHVEYTFVVNGTVYTASGTFDTAGDQWIGNQTCPTTTGGGAPYSVVTSALGTEIWFFLGQEIRVYRYGT